MWAPRYYSAAYWAPRYWPPSGEAPPLYVPIELPDIDLELVGTRSEAILASDNATTTEVRLDAYDVSLLESTMDLAPSRIDVDMAEYTTDVRVTRSQVLAEAAESMDDLETTTADIQPTVTTVDLEANRTTVEVDQ